MQFGNLSHPITPRRILFSLKSSRRKILMLPRRWTAPKFKYSNSERDLARPSTSRIEDMLIAASSNQQPTSTMVLDAGL